MTNATPSTSHTSNPASASSGAPTVTRQVTFTLRSFDHLKATQRKLKAEEGANLSNNEVLALILDQHAQQFPTAGHASSHTKGTHHAE